MSGQPLNEGTILAIKMPPRRFISTLTRDSQIEIGRLKIIYESLRLTSAWSFQVIRKPNQIFVDGCSNGFRKLFCRDAEIRMLTDAARINFIHLGCAAR